MTQPGATISPADTAWMFLATALVLLMTPALGFFYGGMVRAKNVLSTMMMSVASLGVVGLAWALVAYGLAFGAGNDWVGGLEFAGLRGVGLEAKGTIPHLLYMAYQGTFAIVTAALISGAVVERMRFGPYLAFITLWVVCVYAPVAHWAWGGGWLARMGVLDYAGGTVVHVNAAAAAVVAALVLRPRRDYARRALLPHNVPYVLLGAALLWFGWFGFNAGSALGVNDAAALAFVNTFLAPMAALVVWMLLDLRRGGKATAVGAATGIVVGLVAVTPAAGFVSPASAMLIGALAALPSYYAILWRSRSGFDDSLDVAAAHGVGGVTGALLTGVFAEKAWGGVDGLIAGNAGQVGLQALGLLAAALYSAAGTFAILKLVALAMPLRSAAKHEAVGLDVAQHGEEAYARGEGAVLVRPGVATRPVAAPLPAGATTTAVAGGLSMKLIVAIVRSERLSEVLEALYRADVRGVTVSHVQGHGGELEHVETYRGTTVKVELQDKVRLEIGVSDPFVEPTVQAILQSAHTGEVGDGKIFVLPVERVYRIRTGETDERAVTPAVPEPEEEEV